MPGDLKIEKKARKRNKQANKKPKSSSIGLRNYIMENEIRAASKLVPVDCSKDGHSAIY